MNPNETPLAQNEYVAELFAMLQGSGRDTSGLSALLVHVGSMEDFITTAEGKIADMKSQLDAMRELQNHPVKTALQNAVMTLETKIAEVRERLAEIKAGIIAGCKNTIAAFKETGISVLDKLASFFHLKGGLQSVKRDITAGIQECDNTIAKINAFAQEYHAAGRHVGNMARVALNRQTKAKDKEVGKLARTVSAPYRAEKACLVSARKAVNRATNALEQLESTAEANRAERALEKKPSFIDRLDVNKERAEQAKHERQTPERTKAQGAEI
ncbi:MAG: hypothetical protein LBN02_00475 [Oscillospiraceae bacterium]|jgi:hypothetical protein|nr:hypothetical protein [Oscillospiraceae bacterium]